MGVRVPPLAPLNENRIRLVKVNAEELGPTKKKLQVEIPPLQVQEVVESLYRDLQKNAKIKGFRPGRTPRDVLERHYGDYVKEKAISYLINETYPKAISQESIEPIAPPIIDTGDFVPERPFSYSAVVEVSPQIEVQGYKGLRLKGHKGEVSPDEVEEELERIRGLHSQLKQVEDRDRVEMGDFVLLDFQGFLGKRPIREGKAENYLLEVGSSSMVPGIEEGLIGKRAGGEETIKVLFPADHPRKELAGKEVTFRIKVKEIRKKVLPALDDEFARDIGDYKGLEELREKIKIDLQKAKEHRIKEDLRKDVIDQLLQKNPLEVPQYLVQRRSKELLQDLKLRLTAQKRELLPEEERRVHEEYLSMAEREVKASMLLEQIALQEGIEVAEGELEEKTKEMARALGRTSEELKRNASLLAVFRRSLQREKVLDFLVSEAEIEWLDQQILIDRGEND
jgi:trigger factor